MNYKDLVHKCEKTIMQRVKIEKTPEYWEICYTSIVEILFCPYCGKKLK